MTKPTARKIPSKTKTKAIAPVAIAAVTPIVNDAPVAAEVPAFTAIIGSGPAPTVSVFLDSDADPFAGESLTGANAAEVVAAVIADEVGFSERIDAADAATPLVVDTFKAVMVDEEIASLVALQQGAKFSTLSTDEQAKVNEKAGALRKFARALAKRIEVGSA